MNGTFSMTQDPATRVNLSQQIKQQIDAAQQEVQAARAARTAGATLPPPTLAPPVLGTTVAPSNNDSGPPQSVVELSGLFFVMVAAIIIFWPLSRAFSRRISAGAATPKVPAELSGQIAQLTQAVDAIAVEVERISEGQRFTTRLLSEQRAAQPGTILTAAAGSESRPPGQG